MLGTDQNILGTAVKVSRILFSVPAQGFQKLLQAISIYDNFPGFKCCTQKLLLKQLSMNMSTDTLHYIM